MKEVAEGRRLEHHRRHQLPARRQSTTTRPSPADRTRARRASVRDRDLRARPRLQEVQLAILQSTRTCRSTPDALPARCSFCLWPRVTTGPQLPPRAARQRSTPSQEHRHLFPEMKRDLLRRRHLHRGPRALAMHHPGPRNAGHTWSELARQRRLRDAEGPGRDGGLRLFVIGYSRATSRSSEHQERRRHPPRAPVHRRTATKLGI